MAKTKTRIDLREEDVKKLIQRQLDANRDNVEKF